MNIPHQHFKDIYKSPHHLFPALKSLKDNYGLTLMQAKEVYLQVEGIASNIDEYQEWVAIVLEQYFNESTATKP